MVEFKVKYYVQAENNQQSKGDLQQANRPALRQRFQYRSPERTMAVGNTLRLIPSPTDWVYIVLLSWVCTVFAYAAAVELMKKFSAFAMNLTVNMEPVYGIILAFLFFGERERMTTGFYLGTFIILLAVIIYPILNRLLYSRKSSVTT